MEIEKVTVWPDLGNLLHFGQLFKACGNNYFTQITHILVNFYKEIFLGNF